jgi:hypothetical protein
MTACYKLAANIAFVSLVVDYLRSAEIVIVFLEGLQNCLEGKIE